MAARRYGGAVLEQFDVGDERREKGNSHNKRIRGPARRRPPRKGVSLASRCGGGGPNARTRGRDLGAVALTPRRLPLRHQLLVPPVGRADFAVRLSELDAALPARRPLLASLDEPTQSSQNNPEVAASIVLFCVGSHLTRPDSFPFGPPRATRSTRG